MVVRQGEDGRTTDELEAFADYACPWSWLQHRELERLESELRIHRVVRAVELWPVPEPFPDPETLRTEWDTEVVPLARELGVEGRFPSRPIRTRKAHELTAFARTVGHAAEVHAAIFAARFEQDLDIGRIDVLVELAEAVGLDRTRARIALDIDEFADVVTRDRERAAALGVTRLPTLLLWRGERVTPAMHVGFTDSASLRRRIAHVRETGSG